MPSFSNKSKECLLTCDPRLQTICFDAIAIMDFTVLEGHRDQETQNLLYAEGKSQLKYPYSRHNRNPSKAVDIAPYPIDWNNKERFYALAGVMFTIAEKYGYKLTWGGTWGGLDDKNIGGFYDLPHFQIED